jgi:hypothetical protein
MLDLNLPIKDDVIQPMDLDLNAIPDGEMELFGLQDGTGQNKEPMIAQELGQISFLPSDAPHSGTFDSSVGNSQV